MTKLLEKAKAIILRKEGNSLCDIASSLRVSKSSVSLWVRDIPQPEKFTKKYKHERKLKRLEKLNQERQKRRVVKTPSKTTKTIC